MEKQKLSELRTTVIYDINISGSYDNIDIEFLEGVFNLPNKGVQLLINTKSPVTTIINNEKISIKFKAMIWHKLIPNDVDGNSYLNVKLGGIYGLSFISLEIKDKELDEFNDGLIEEFLKNELLKTSNIEVNYILKDGPFNEFTK